MLSLRSMLSGLPYDSLYVNRYFGGRGEIRTHDFTDLQSVAFDLSTTRPLKNPPRFLLRGLVLFGFD